LKSPSSSPLWFLPVYITRFLVFLPPFAIRLPFFSYVAESRHHSVPSIRGNPRCLLRHEVWGTRHPSPRKASGSRAPHPLCAVQVLGLYGPTHGGGTPAVSRFRLCGIQGCFRALEKSRRRGRIGLCTSPPLPPLGWSSRRGDCTVRKLPHIFCIIKFFAFSAYFGIFPHNFCVFFPSKKNQPHVFSSLGIHADIM